MMSDVKISDLPASSTPLSGSEILPLVQGGLTKMATVADVRDGLAAASDLKNHETDTANPHTVTASQVGLGNVDNTSDVNKPVSTAQQAAIDAKVSKAGDTMTGHLSVPAGASGTQVPQAQQVPSLVRAMAVGAVSQVGGVPTGAIIESGSNANGTYARFADGTQICCGFPETVHTTSSAAGSLYAAGVASVTFPADFISNDGVSVAALFLRTAGTQGHFFSLAAVTESLFSGVPISVSNTGQGRVMYVAIGRWF